MDENAQGLILAAIFVLVAIGLGGLAIWGVMNLNIVASVFGIFGEVAWFFAGKYII
ncbi:MAG: hypothetical protein JW840_09255 [Candidatus Thermoplasmatota archaeon]|nr:hypothetical protein [Candidatus Thermoplasmatota archaeon]